MTFWTRVYTEFGNGDFVLHDRQRTGLIYEIVHVPEADDPARAAQRAAPTVELLRAKYQGLLTALAASQDPAELGPDALRVAEAWGAPARPTPCCRPRATCASSKASVSGSRTDSAAPVA